MKRFQDIIGQEQLKKQLMGAIEHSAVSHAYIIQGERYAGKEFIANVFAAALQCEGDQVEPCGECHSCIQANSKNHPDIIHVTHEKPGSIGVDDIREQIGRDVSIRPYNGKYKIYIVNEAEIMTAQAQNALLKTLEEPPEYVVILLLVTNISALLPTILSRCVVVNMKPVRDVQIKDYLVKELDLTQEKAEVCVAFARGNVGKARQLAANEDFDKIREEAITLLKYIGEMEVSEVANAIKRIGEFKLQINDYLDIFAIWYRDVLLFKATKDANGLIFKGEIQYIRKVADRSTYEGIEEILSALDNAKRRLDANVNFELVMELLLLTIHDHA